jgi:glycine C-acetyltransferase
MKGTEAALLFSSGYNANVGLVVGLAQKQDLVLYDAYSHASFCDGLRLAGVPSMHFEHNAVSELERLLQLESVRACGDLFVGVEGVYSMDGDLAPLDRIVPLCERYGATLILDDAHGTGVMGERGRGTAEHFGLDGAIPLTMGTFSKTFAVTGGFVAGPSPLINYLRFFARSYMFSASLPPVVVATVLAGMDVIEHESWLLEDLRRNVAYAAESLRQAGFDVTPQAAIIPLRVPDWMDIRHAGRLFHERGIFVNSVEYPAVPKAEQRFRISMMATHRREDIDRLVEAAQAVWKVMRTVRPRTDAEVAGRAA